MKNSTKENSQKEYYGDFKPIEYQHHHLKRYYDLLLVVLLFLNLAILIVPNIYYAFFIPKFIDVGIENEITFFGYSISYYLYEFYIYVEVNFAPYIELLHFKSWTFLALSTLSILFWVTYFFVPLWFLKIPFLKKDHLHNYRRSTHRKIHIFLYILHLYKSFGKVNNMKISKFMKVLEEENQTYETYPLFTSEIEDLYERFHQELRLEEENKYIIGLDAKVQDQKDIAPQHIKCTTGENLNHGFNVKGPTGAGKTIYLRSISYQHTMKGFNSLYIDGKGTYEDTRILNALISKAGGEFKMISIDDNRETYNVIWTKSDKLDLERLAEAFFTIWKGANSKQKDGAAEFYYEYSWNYYTLYVKALIALGLPYNTNDLRALCMSPMVRKRFFINAKEQCSEEALPVIEEVASELHALDMTLPHNQTPQTVCSGLISFLKKWSDPKFNSYNPTIEITDLIDKKMRPYFLYVHCPTNSSSQLAVWLGQVFQSQIRLLTGYIGQHIAEKDLRPILLVIEEFEYIADSQIIHVTSKGRSSGVYNLYSHQTDDGLAYLVSPEWKDMIKKNLRSMLVFIQNEGEDPEDVSKIPGTRDDVKYTDATTQGLYNFIVPSSRGSQREVNEYILHPDVLRNLNPVGQAVFIDSKDPTNPSIVNISKTQKSYKEYEPTKPTGKIREGYNLMKILTELHAQKSNTKKTTKKKTKKKSTTFDPIKDEKSNKRR